MDMAAKCIKQRILAVRQLSHPHTHAEIRICVLGVLREYGVRENQVVITCLFLNYNCTTQLTKLVADSAANVRKSFGDSVVLECDNNENDDTFADSDEEDNDDVDNETFIVCFPLLVCKFFVPFLYVLHRFTASMFCTLAPACNLRSIQRMRLTEATVRRCESACFHSDKKRPNYAVAERITNRRRRRTVAPTANVINALERSVSSHASCFSAGTPHSCCMCNEWQTNECRLYTPATRCGVVVPGIRGHAKNAGNVFISFEKSHLIKLNFYFISKLITTQPFTGGRPNCSSLLFTNKESHCRTQC
jgi:hypothetical protein